MLQWANQSSILCFLDSNEYPHVQGKYECLCAKDALQIVEETSGNCSTLKNHFEFNKDWLFGHFSYEFKNKIEQLSSSHPSHFAFPLVQFFQPKVVCYILRSSYELVIESVEENPNDIWEEIQETKLENETATSVKVAFKKRIEHEEYLAIIEQLRAHIKQGDCYEINFCNESFAKNVSINPLHYFQKLNTISKAPFAGFYKVNNQYLLCASPERYVQKIGQKITAQPIKGTAKRGTDEKQDESIKQTLLADKKERAENVMIVDLMRNDLARFCKVDSVKVEELFGLYTFSQVHQLISTISGTLMADKNIFDIFRLSFPMGSMTGAPKIMVMKLIEQYEKVCRELYSGSIGYIAPNGDFDFNVVIRSVLYNANSGYLSYQTGGAITFDSIPENEWQETLLKGKALEQW